MSTAINESIFSDEIKEHLKENRIDHMTYLPGMEDIGSEIMDQVIARMNAYDYDSYSEAGCTPRPGCGQPDAGGFRRAALPGGPAVSGGDGGARSAGDAEAFR